MIHHRLSPRQAERLNRGVVRIVSIPHIAPGNSPLKPFGDAHEKLWITTFITFLVRWAFDAHVEPQAVILDRRRFTLAVSQQPERTDGEKWLGSKAFSRSRRQMFTSVQSFGRTRARMTAVVGIGG